MTETINQNCISFQTPDGEVIADVTLPERVMVQLSAEATQRGISVEALASLELGRFLREYMPTPHGDGR